MDGVTEGGRAALLVMDIQRAIVPRITDADVFLARLRKVIEAARSAGMPVLYVVVRFREGYPEVSPRNKSFSGIAQRASLQGSSEATEIHPAVAPQPGDVVITKKRVGAFTGSDLEVVLRSMGIETLVLTGIATSGVVLSTIRAAADMDYRLVVIADCCADSDEEVHRVLTEKVFPRQAEVLDARGWIEGLGEE